MAALLQIHVMTGVKQTSFLFFAVASHSLFSGFLRCFHLPPWSKVIIVWIELSEWEKNDIKHNTLTGSTLLNSVYHC